MELGKVQTKPGAIVAMVQEPWIHKDKICGNPRNMIRYDSGNNNRAKRSCIYVSKHLQSWVLPEFTDEDVVAVRLSGLGGTLPEMVIVASAYMAHGERVPPAKLVLLVQYCENNDISLVVGSDANAHHEAWGSTDTNERGIELLGYLASTRLMWGNIGHKPTFRTRNRREVLDLTLVTEDLSSAVRGWHVSDIPSLSDHCYIRFHFNLTRNRGPLCRQVRNTNWPLFREKLEMNLHHTSVPTGEIQSVESLDSVTEKVTEDIINAWEHSCPLKRAGQQSINKWWTKELGASRRETRKLLRKATNTNSDEDWTRYRNTLRNLKYEIRKTKRKSWWTYCKSISDNNSVAKMLRVLKTDNATKLGCIEKDNGVFTDSPKETLQCMLDAHLREFDTTADQGVVFNHDPLERHVAGEVLAEEAVKAAIFRSDPFKSPGSDGIYPAMLQQGWGGPGALV
jgi:hypothetical protein